MSQTLSEKIVTSVGTGKDPTELDSLEALTAAELAYLDITTLGTGAASKAVVLDASGDYTFPASGTIIYPSGATLTLQSGSTFNVAGTFQVGGSAVTSTAAELNYLDLATLGTGAASKAIVLDANGAYVGPTASTTKFTWSVTSTSTDGGTSVEPFVHNTTMTGVGGVGGRARFELDTAVVLGGWANALKAQTQFASGGAVTGLGSAFVAELIAGDGMSAGSYAPLEIELGMPTGALTGTRMSFMSINLYGADATTFDGAGFLFDLNGVTAGASNLFASNAKTGIGMTHTLKCQILGTTYYIALHTSANFGGS